MRQKVSPQYGFERGWKWDVGGTMLVGLADLAQLPSTSCMSKQTIEAEFKTTCHFDPPGANLLKSYPSVEI
jgi:hypothetical protein